MLEMGELIWQAFTQEVQRKLADSTLAYAVKIIHSLMRARGMNVGQGSRQTQETWTILGGLGHVGRKRALHARTTAGALLYFHLMTL